MIKTGFCVRFSVVTLITSSFLMLESCNADISVPNGVSIDSCYYNGDALVMRLAEKSVISRNRKISSFESGRDQSGSYVLFRPAIHVAIINGVYSPIINNDMNQNYVSTIIESGKINILMPTEPLGQTRLIQRNCSGA